MFDFHMHSRISFDSEAEPMDMVRAAAAAGLKEICFTDHFDHHTDPKEPPYMFSVEDYRAAYEPISAPGITVRRGIEFGLTEWNMPYREAILGQYPYDFVIGSVHEVDGKDPYYADYWTGDVQKDFRRSLEQTLLCVQRHEGFDVLGHLTFVCKFPHNPTGGPVPFAENRDIADAIMEQLVKKGIGMEINTSGVSATGDFLPGAQFLRRFKELGGEIITVGSDAHDPGHVGQHVPQALEVLKDIFGYVCTFRDRQPVFHKL